MQLALFDVGQRTAAPTFYQTNLLHVLGDARLWSYHGECVDAGRPSGRCSCGHVGLRYLFTIHGPNGRTAIVGSTCIGHFRSQNPAMVEKIETDSKELRNAAVTTTD